MTNLYRRAILFHDTYTKRRVPKMVLESLLTTNALPNGSVDSQSFIKLDSTVHHAYAFESRSFKVRDIEPR